ncbi:helix-turn-helix domain-containing protein [Amycolatopsis sp. NPDC024027]|uniref:TetR/AcrR family transcriptional regulator n=1 Tax=Amycolatopsis sp. NPDC024027 TaxID=3154327 RepID=UPI003400CDBB
MAVAERDGIRTRARILEVAQELFTERGYAGTSIADIARELGTSKAALYYHFSSKEQLLGALLAEPLSGYADLADRCRAEHLGPADVLGALIDLTAETHTVFALLSNDPSITPLLQRLHDVEGSIQTFVELLAGPNPAEAMRAKAWAAFAVAKQGTFWAVQAGDGTLSAVARKALLAAAVRCLKS